MKKAKKTFLAVACAGVLVVGSVAATMAYLTATTDTVTNTFTAGNVDFGDGTTGSGLDEAATDEYGEKIDINGDDKIDNADRRTANKYKLIPGASYIKDPIVHMAGDSEDAYVFVKVANGIADLEDASNTIAAQMTTNGWLPVDATNLPGVYVYAKGSTLPVVVTGGSNLPVFESFKLASEANVESIYVVENGKVTNKVKDDAKITVVAYAIQAEGFAGQTAAQIWAAGNWS